MYHYQSVPTTPVGHGTDRNVLKVTGEGTVSATPDRAMITLGAVTEGTNLSSVQQENSTAISNIIRALVGLGIPRPDIQTTEYRVEPQYDYTEGKQVFRGYRVTHLLQVTINQIGQTGRVVDTAVASGANSVSNIQFSVSRPEAYYNQALTLAMKIAEQKALTLAATLGVTLHKVPKQVEEVLEVPRPIPLVMALTTEKSAAAPIQPGQLKITATVRAEYTYL